MRAERDTGVDSGGLDALEEQVRLLQATVDAAIARAGTESAVLGRAHREVARVEEQLNDRLDACLS